MSKKLLGNLTSALGADIPSSIVVFLVALPLCLGVAIASDAEPFAGIIAGIVGGLVVGVISGSQVSVSGPAAGLTAIVAGAIATSPSYEAFLAAIVLSGVMQIGLGFARAGIVGEYIPASVIKGMLAAIGLILILKQIPHLLGRDSVPEGDEEFIQADGENTFSEIFRSCFEISPTAVVIGFISIGVLLLWDTKFLKKRRVFQLVPGSLVVVIIGIVINELLKTSFPGKELLSSHLVTIPVANSFSEFGNFFSTPDFSHLFTKDQLRIALTLAIVASLESLLSIEASDKIDPMKRFTPPNRELVAQGVGNMTSGFLGGLPVTAVIVRSSANISAGGKTKMSAILHGILLLGCVYFFPNILNKIPLASLAAILIMVGYKLTKPSIFKDLYAKGINQIIPFVVTIVAILFTDLLVGIFIGMIAGMFFIIRSNFKNSLFHTRDGKNHLIRLRGTATFLNKPKLKKILESIEDDGLVFIDLSKTDFIDNDLSELINDFKQQAAFRNIDVDITYPERLK